MDTTPKRNLTGDEREARLQYLKDLFRLSFRTNLGMAEAINDTDSDFKGDDDDYDCMTEFAPDEPSGCGDDEDMAEFRADFQALDAEDEYLQLCLDYYRDVLAEMQQKQKLSEWNILTTSVYAEAIPDKKSRGRAVTKSGLKVHDHHNVIKKRSYYSNRIKHVAERMTLNEQHQADVQAKIVALEKELGALQTPATTTTKLKKTLLPQAVALTIPPELTKWQTASRAL